MLYANRAAIVLILLGLLTPGLSQAGQPQDRTAAETAQKTLTISGYAGLPGIMMTGLPGNPVTDSAGIYRAQVPSGWSGKVTPVGEGCRFDPPSREYRNVTADMMAEDYVVTGLSVPRPPGLGAGRPDVLVIPTSEVDAKKLAETSEDMRVMLQVLREKLSEPRMIRGALVDYGDFFGDSDRAAEVFYLQGHAVVFVMRVDFPLFSPGPPQAGEGEVDKGAGDPVWQRARQRLYSPANSIGHPGLPGQAPGVAVERVKETLLQSLKHAANIRNVGPSELIVLTVISQSESSGSPTPASAGGSYSRNGGGWFEGSAYSTASSSFGPSGGATQADSGTRSRGSMGGRGAAGRTGPGSAPGAATALLTIQAKKADIDAFAKGDLSLEQFQPRVKTFTY
jgi:hypothetical protein